MKKRVLSMLMTLVLCLTLLPAPAWAEAGHAEGGAIVQEEATPAISEQATENGIAVQNGGLVSAVSGNASAECICETHCEQEAVNPDCPVCSAENADLSACLGKEAELPLMAAAASTEETISGNVTWENKNITTPVIMKGDTTITLKGENTITITETSYTAALNMYSHSLTIQGSGSLKVNVPKRKNGIEDGSWNDTAGGTLTIKDGAKITTNGGLYGLYAKSIVIENGTLKLNSDCGIVTASLTMNSGTLYATGKYGATWSRKGTARSIDPSLTILYSDEQNANTDDMSVGTADDTTREEAVKTIYIAKMGPRASLTVGAQQGTLQESLGSQTATFSVTGSKVRMDTLKATWEGNHTGLEVQTSDNGATITVTADNTVKEGRYKLKLTADGEAGATPAKATATATVTVAAAPRNPITIRTQPQVSKKIGEFKADVWVRAQLESGTSGNITYQWYVNGKEFKGTGSGSNRITLTPSDLTTTAGKNWEYSGQVYCKLSYKGYTAQTDTVPVTFNTCPHEKYTNEGKCQQCGEPCSKDVLFIRNGIPYTFEGDNPDVGFILFSGGTAYFVRDTTATLKAGSGDTADKRDVTLDLQGHRVKALDLQNCPYNSVTIKNGTINGIETQGPTALILDGVTTDVEVLSDRFTLTVKGNCVFSNPVTLSENTQLQGGTFPLGINVEPGKQALDLLADGYAFADADSGEILNASNVSIQGENVKVVEHTCQYQNGKCVCGRVCDHAGKVDSAGYCTFCKALVEAFETGGKRYTSLENALAAAQDRDTITLRGPLTIENAEPIEISKNIVLNLNGHTLSKSAEKALLRILGSNVAIINGKVLSTCTSKPAVAVEVGKFSPTGAKLTLDNVTLEGSVGGGTGSGGTGLSICTGNEAVVTSGTFPGGIYTEGALTMSGGSAARLELGALEGIPVTLSGGSFGSIKIENGADYQSLLAEGYAYQKQGGALLKLSEMNENTAVTVVKCSHPDDPSGGKVCPYCGYAAEVTKTDGSISYYLTADAAIAAAGGGTVKLLANAGAITISSPLKLDLNGKTATKLTVTGDVTLASLLPEGYVFKSGSTWITDLSRTELTNVSMAKIPIKSMNYPTEMSMEYGGAGTILVTVTKETGTGVVSFQWYKVEGGNETAVGSATTKNQFDLSAQKLPVGKYIFRFSATCDGYTEMSKDIVVTVQKADIRSGLITPPTAQENLTYTGQEQALITAGSVTNNCGTMQYSLTENGTYSADIPTATDAGTYTVWYRVIGDANHNDTAPASVVVSIGKKPLTITGVTAASKPYDGTTNADISGVTFDGMNLKRGTDYTVTASFDDAGVGNGKNITATVTLMGQAAKNYALEQSSFITTGSITKAAAPDFTKETALTIINGHEKTYTVTLPTLPTLKTPKEYGALTYEIGEIKLDGRYYTGGAKVENGKLTLPIQKNDVKTPGSVGTVTVVIKSTNYEDITLTVNVNATDKFVPTVTAPTANALTYNGTEQALVTAGKTTGGTMLYRLDNSEWSEQIPTAKNVGKYTVWYKVQGNAEYADVAEQSLTVTVSDRPSGGGGASGGGGGGAAPAPTPADADVITVKEDTKDNTTSKPGAETDTTTTTKTTVKNTTTEMTKNEQGQDVSKTTASVSKDLGDKLLDQAVSNKSDMIEITVKSSDANNGSGAGSTGAADSVKATEVELPKATVNAIAKDTNADLVIKTDNGEVVLDNKTLETIAGAAKGDTVTIVVGENTRLKETQKPAEKIVGKNGTLFDLVAKIGEKHLHQFEGGKAYVILPMPDKLKGKDILVIYIDDNGLCKILNHSVVKIGAEYYIRFTTPHFSTFAVVDKDEAEGLIKEQNAAHVKELMQSAKFKVTTTKTSKKSVKVQVAAKSSKTMISDIKSLGYTVKYQFYRSTKKDAGYKLLKTSSKNSFISTKGTKYYYKARVLVYDGKTLVAKSALRQCSYGARK